MCLKLSSCFLISFPSYPSAMIYTLCFIVLGLSAIKVLFAVKDEDAIRFPDLKGLVSQLSVLSQLGIYLVHACIKFFRMSIISGAFARLKQQLASAAAGSYDSAAVQSEIDGYINDNPCVLFSFTKCPYCIKAKSILIDEYGATVKVVSSVILCTSSKLSYKD